MSVILGFLILLMLLLLSYIVYRSFVKKKLIMLLIVCVQLFAISMAILCLAYNVQALELIQACFLLFGLILPLIYPVYDLYKVFDKLKRNGVYEGFIQSGTPDSDSNGILKRSLHEINPIFEDIPAEDLFRENVSGESEKYLTNAKKILIKAHSRIAKKDFQTARNVYDVMTSLLDDNAGLYFNLGNILFNLMDYNGAASAYKKSLAISRDSNRAKSGFDRAKAYYNAGCSQFMLKKFDAAVKYFENALDLKKEIPYARENIALSHAAAGNMDLALEHFRKAVAEDDKNPRLHFLFGNLLAEVKSFEQAEAELLKSIGLEPGLSEGYTELGRILSVQGKQKEAVEAYDKAIKHFPNDYSVYYSKGNICYRLGLKKEAIECYKTVTQLKPDNFNAFYNMAIALDEQGSSDEAIKCFKKALALKPDFPDAYNNLAIVLSNAGRVDEALKTYEEGIRRNPEEYSLFLNMGVTLSEAGRNREAVAAFRNALDIKPDEFQIYYYLGAALMETRNYNDAVEAYKLAIRIKPSDSELYYGIASVYSLLGRYDIACDNLRRAIELNAEIKSDVKANSAFDGMRGREDFRKMVS